MSQSQPDRLRETMPACRVKSSRWTGILRTSDRPSPFVILDAGAMEAEIQFFVPTVEQGPDRQDKRPRKQQAWRLDDS
jgi:hypothetical protein